MEKEEFLSSFHLLTTHIEEVLQEVNILDVEKCLSSGYVIEVVRRYNPAEIITVGQHITLFDSLQNAALLRKFVLESKTSSLVTCEQSLREKVLTLFLAELTLLAERCVAENEPEPRELFMRLVSRITGKYESEIASGDYMMYVGGWFPEQVTAICNCLAIGNKCLRKRYQELNNLITTTVLLLDASVLKNESVGEKFTQHLNDYFKNLAESAYREKNKVL